MGKKLLTIILALCVGFIASAQVRCASAPTYQDHDIADYEVMQVIEENQALGINMRVSESIVFIMYLGNSQLYDGKILDDSKHWVYYIGTYTYDTNSGTRKTVPALVYYDLHSWGRGESERATQYLMAKIRENR